MDASKLRMMMNMMSFMAKASPQLAKSIANVESRALSRKIEGIAGAGAVKVTVNGRAQCIDVKIDPTFASDVVVLEDLTKLAINNALEKVAAESEKDFMELAAEMMKAGPFGGFPNMSDLGNFPSKK